MNIKKIGKIISLIFIIAGIILISGKREWFPDFYNPFFMGVMAFVSAFLVSSPRLFLKPNNPEQEKVLDSVQTGAILVLSLNALGALGLFQLYKLGFQYDRFIHFLNSFIFTIIFAKAYGQWFKASFEKSVILAMAIIFLVGAGWEIYEFVGDGLFKTEMAGIYGKFVTEDTFWDLIMNLLGIIVAAISLIVFRKKESLLFSNSRE